MDEFVVNLSDNDGEEVPDSPGKKEESYSIARKLEVINFAIENSVHSAGWVRDRSRIEAEVSRRMIVEKAKKLHTPSFLKPMESKFRVARSSPQLHYRMPTTRCQKPPKEYAQKLVDLIVYIS
uniref:Uncharacterized protein n=1 Tax=Ditylenchus dipsaci TaxID=166011 RepID=A0A915D0L7_9BILA